MCVYVCVWMCVCVYATNLVAFFTGHFAIEGLYDGALHRRDATHYNVPHLFIFTVSLHIL